MFDDIPKVALCFVLAFALPPPSVLAGAGFLLAAPAPSARAALLFTFFFCDFFALATACAALKKNAPGECEALLLLADGSPVAVWNLHMKESKHN